MRVRAAWIQTQPSFTTLSTRTSMWESQIESSQALSSSPISSSILSAASNTVGSDPQTFEAIAPDSTTLIGFGAVVLLSIVAGLVWQNEVVPISRTKLALSKRDGEVREYLDDLKGSTSLEGDIAVTENIKPNVGDGRDFERWLFSDWLNSNKDGTRKNGRQKEPALPILKQAKWNSGDNPVLVTSALLFAGVLLTSISERIFM